MNAVFEFLLNVESFKNIDLFRQGYYHVRCSFYVDAPNLNPQAAAAAEAAALAAGAEPPDPPIVRRRALPYHIMSSGGGGTARGDSADVTRRPATIDDSVPAFRTRSNRVQYCEQLVPWGDACLFRLETDPGHRPPVFLEVELMFAEYSANDSLEGKPPPALEQYQSVCSRRLCMEDVFSQPVHAFYPLTFDDHHFSVVNLTVHSTLIDFRFRPHVLEYRRARPLVTADGRVAPPPPLPVANSLTEALFRRTILPDVNGKPRKSYAPEEVAEVADKYHRYYMHSLILAYNNLAAAFGKLLDRVVPPEVRARLGPSPIFPVVLPAHVGSVPEPAAPAAAAAAAAAAAPAAAARGGAGAAASAASDASPPQVAPPPVGANAQRLPMPSLAKLSERLKDQGQLQIERVASSITGDLVLVAEQAFQLWTSFYEVIPKCGERLVQVLRAEWAQRTRERFEGFVFHETSHGDDRWRLADEDMDEVHAHICSVVRRSAHVDSLPRLPLMDSESMVPPEQQLVLFDQTFNLKAASPPPPPQRPQQQQQQLASARLQRSVSEDRKSPPTGSPPESGGAGAADSLRDASELTRELATEAKEGDMDAPPPIAQTPDEPAPIALAALPVMAAGGAVAAAAAALSSSSSAAAAAAAAAPVAAAPLGLLGATETVGSRRVPAAPANFDMPDLGAKLERFAGKHVVFFVHGYQGNSWDMRLWKNRLSLLFPHVICHLSTANEQSTEGNIEEMGQRLSAEIDQFITSTCKKGLGRVSFVAHSLGGLIVRSALTQPAMKQYLSKLYTLVTLATPHCGYFMHDSSLLETGMWFLKKWSKSMCLSQLSLSETEDPRDSFVYKLSEKPGLQHFQHVFLFSSLQDKYVPFHSARIEVVASLLQDKRRGEVYQTMANNLLAPLAQQTLKRIDVNFVPKKKNLDSFIGRTAHIYFLDQESLIGLVVHVYRDYFI